MSHLPIEPSSIWVAPLIAATEATTAYTDYSAAQLLRQLRQLELTPSYAHPSLIVQVRTTIDFCKEQLVRYGVAHTAFSFNGGKDCTVLLHLLRLAFQELAEEQQQPPPTFDSLTCIYFQEANEFHEIASFMRSMSSAYSLNLAHMCGSFKEGLVALQAAKPIRAIFMGPARG